MKVATYEAKGIKPLSAYSPPMCWLYGILSLQVASNLPGIAEVTTDTMIALRPL